MADQETLLGGRYRLTEQIGVGRFGELWRAMDEQLGRTVAAKVLHPTLLLEAPGSLPAFFAEALTTASIRHPAVVEVYDASFAHDSSTAAYMVMEYINGRALSRVLAESPRLSTHDTMLLVANAAGALQAAHDKGIVHGDVKPGNIMIRNDGSAVLTDFGIAQLHMGAALGSALDSLRCGAPQLLGRQPTAHTDIYSLGVVAYRCLAGRWPFDGTLLEIAKAQEAGDAAGVPFNVAHPLVTSILNRALQKDPRRRWQTAAALGEAARQAAKDFADRDVFISYRWNDEKGFATAIAERIGAVVGPSNVYFDEAGRVGVDFDRASIAAAWSSSAMLVIIGPDWLDPRLNDPHDLVRREIETALGAGRRVVAVLVNGAKMPHRSQLPESIAVLADFKAADIANTRTAEDIRQLPARLGLRDRDA